MPELIGASLALGDAVGISSDRVASTVSLLVPIGLSPSASAAALILPTIPQLKMALALPQELSV